MSITDELREWGDSRAMESTQNTIRDFADCIDTKHEIELRKREDKGYSAGYNAGYAVGFANADDWLSDNESEMGKHGWVKLPKDVDGEYIRIGDEVDTDLFGTVKVDGFVHNAVAFYNYSEQPVHLCTTPASLCRHHHEPTVEDVLLEFANEVQTCFGTVDAIAEYAEKVREAIEHEQD